MSPKELLYIEDAMGHEKILQTLCQDCSQRIQDKELKTFVSQLATEHEKIFGQLYQLV